MANDFYRVLGVDRSASAKEISSAYRRLARKYHPDIAGGDSSTEAWFKEINAAHDVLGDPEKRAAYDKWGDQWEHAEQLEEMQRQGGFRGAPGGGSGGFRFDFGDAGGFSGFGGVDPSQFEGGGLGEIFGNIFGGRAGGPARGRDVEHALTVSLDEAFHGATRTIQTQRAADDGPRLGRIEVKVPPGAATGTRVKVAGKGRPGPRGGEPGDLFLAITVAGDPRFERRGDDLRSELDVPIATAALGGEVTVPTITGQVALRIPPETQNGRVFRLAGQGMPRLKRPSERGDLLAAARLQMPEPLTERHLELFRRLRELEGPDA